jgi:hypothetical protein
MAEAEALLRAGHPDVAGLCLALHDWAQELRILQREREHQVGQPTTSAASERYAQSLPQACGAPDTDRTWFED